MQFWVELVLSVMGYIHSWDLHIYFNSIDLKNRIMKQISTVLLYGSQLLHTQNTIVRQASYMVHQRTIKVLC